MSEVLQKLRQWLGQAAACECMWVCGYVYGGMLRASACGYGGMFMWVCCVLLHVGMLVCGYVCMWVCEYVYVGMLCACACGYGYGERVGCVMWVVVGVDVDVNACLMSVSILSVHSCVYMCVCVFVCVRVLCF
jgi:hypothetical protein